MLLRQWEELPEHLRTEAVRPYYDMLQKHRFSLACKRIFDFLVSLILLLVIWPVFIFISIAIKFDSPGPVFYKQERITTYERKFKIWKFRTMVENADKIGAQITVSNDRRVTKVGKILRNTRFDELPQLINIIAGDMSFVGTRPEVVKYVEMYKPEFFATLLLPAGVTSEASIRYKDEYRLLSEADDVEKVYVEEVLPAKMIWNLNSIERFSFSREVLTMIRTVLAIVGKEYN